MRGKRQDAGRPRSLPDHGTPDGDVFAELIVRVHKSGALSVHGPIENREWALAALENAKDAIRNYRGANQLVVPGKDVAITKL